jgi:hypothetical protein
MLAESRLKNSTLSSVSAAETSAKSGRVTRVPPLGQPFTRSDSDERELSDAERLGPVARAASPGSRADRTPPPREILTMARLALGASIDARRREEPRTECRGTRPRISGADPGNLSGGRLDRCFSTRRLRTQPTGHSDHHGDNEPAALTFIGSSQCSEKRD